MSADTAKKAGPQAAVTASIVSGDASSAAGYPMYEARDISPSGALLIGGLFLEVNEVFTLELALGGDAVRATARVVRLERGAPGMHVAFSNLTDTAREALAKRSNG